MKKTTLYYITFGKDLANALRRNRWGVTAVDSLSAAIIFEDEESVNQILEFIPTIDFTTTAEPDEMITEIRFPEPAPHAALTEFAQRRGDFAVVAASARLDLADEEIRTSRIVLGGVAEKPHVVDIDLAGQPATGHTWRAAGETAAAQVNPPSDGHGSSDYRRKLTATLVARALAEAAA